MHTLQIYFQNHFLCKTHRKPIQIFLQITSLTLVIALCLITASAAPFGRQGQQQSPFASMFQQNSFARQLDMFGIDQLVKNAVTINDFDKNSAPALIDSGAATLPQLAEMVKVATPLLAEMTKAYIPIIEKYTAQLRAYNTERNFPTPPAEMFVF